LLPLQTTGRGAQHETSRQTSLAIIVPIDQGPLTPEAAEIYVNTRSSSVLPNLASASTFVGSSPISLPIWQAALVVYAGG
jgi:hypothetical protein